MQENSENNRSAVLNYFKVTYNYDLLNEKDCIFVSFSSTFSLLMLTE